MNFARMTLLAVLCLLLLGLLSANAQMREVIIENTGLLNSIRDAIVADLAATDTATVNNTKYILRRGETYVHSEEYEPSHKIWLEAEAGDGPRPRILAVSAGGEAARLLRSSGSTTFIGLRYEGLDSDGNHTDNAPARQRGDGTVMTVKDCILPDHRHEVFRVDGANQSWFIENNIIVRNYRKTDWRRGYMFSFRNQQIDTVVIRNNTFYNATGVLTHQNNHTGNKYVEFSKNTVYGIGGLMVGGFGGAWEAAMLNFGIAQNIVCKDNIFINSGFWGWEPQFADSISVINIDLTDSTESIEISNNNIWRDPEFLASNPDTVEVVKWFDPELASLIGEDGKDFGFISEPVTFNNVPDLTPLKQALTDYFASPTAVFDIYLELPTTPDAAEVDFGYTAKLSPTASSTGGPLGAERWFPGVVVGVDDRNPASIVDSFELHGNYPNPFNPGTSILFDLPSSAKVQVSVFNSLGQRVYESPVTAFAAGNNLKYSLDGRNWTSGLYFYQVKAEMQNSTAVKTGKMMLVK